MGLLIRDGEIVTPDARYKAEIYVEDQTITRIGTDLPVPPGTEIIDASGKWIFPGFIDPHVHIYLPFMATFAKDTHETASVAALIGGTTTVIEMCGPSRTEDALAGYSLWKDKAQDRSACDYAFHMTVSRFDENTEAQLREIVRDGTTSFKIFLSYKNFFGIDDGEMYQALTLAKELGVIVAAHCENAELVGRLQQALLAEGKTGPEWHEPSRPESVEAEGTARFATFLENTGAAGYVVHLSCLPRLKSSGRRKSAWGETLHRVGRTAFPSGQIICGTPWSRGHAVRDVSATAGEKESGGALDRSGRGTDRYRRHGPLPF
jgi:dihydropyrimidinase